MDCIYNTGGFCYRNNAEGQKECQYIGSEADCEAAEEEEMEYEGKE